MPEGSSNYIVRLAQRPYRYIKYGYWEPNYAIIDQIIKRRFQNRNDLNIVQIGANDGVANDGVKPWIDTNRHAKAILVEPGPMAFRKLTEYRGGGEGVYLENCAISSQAGNFDFYEVGPTESWVHPWFTSRLSSLSMDAIRSQYCYKPEYDQFIIKHKVPVLKFEELMTKYSMPVVDWLYIDAEGSDFDILKSIDLESWKIDVIQYEWSGLNRSDILESFRFLRSRKYKLYQEGRDIVALLRGN